MRRAREKGETNRFLRFSSQSSANAVGLEHRCESLGEEEDVGANQRHGALEDSHLHLAIALLTGAAVIVRDQGLEVKTRTPCLPTDITGSAFHTYGTTTQRLL